MPVVDKKGYSEITPIKQEDLGHFLRYHFEVASRVISKPASPWNKYYLYIDANAGDGENQAGCVGSPLVFNRFKFRLSVPYKAFFIDNNPANIERLKEKLPDEEEIICKDNRIAIPLIVAEHIPQHEKTIGLLYTDPNGVPDKDLIKIASGLLPRVDILIRYNTMGAKRSFHLGEPRLCELMESTKKECWLIKNLCSNDRWMWTFIFGTNYANFKAWEKQGFYRIDSREGKHILELCSHKKSEANNNQQLSLFDEPTENNYRDYLHSSQFKAVKEKAMRRAGGMCEMCKHKRATDPHHKKYTAKWWKGEVDSVDNLIMLCHDCHCEVHGKEN